jgi:hypothetical protein
MDVTVPGAEKPPERWHGWDTRMCSILAESAFGLTGGWYLNNQKYKAKGFAESAGQGYLCFKYRNDKSKLIRDDACIFYGVGKV